jgi:peroxiredoxin
MSKSGSPAPAFSLQDHFGRTVAFDALRGKCNVLLLFYPLDWTPT